MIKIPKTNFDFMKYKMPFMVLSILAIIASLFIYLYKDLNYGVDFKGGIKLLFQFSDAEEVSEHKLDDALKKAGKGSIVVQRFGKPEDNTFVLRAEVSNEAPDLFKQSVVEVFKKDLTLGNPTLMRDEFVGPKVGKELKRKGQFAVIVAWLIMLLYIGFRFDFNFAPGALISLIHDVLITVGLFALTGREVNLTVVAAFLTIIGYSINDTIVIYDRIRENVAKHKTKTSQQIVNLSLNETLSRTIMTSLTVFFVVVVLFFFADGDIQSFAFAMIIGSIVGVYSSLFVASPIYLFCKKYRKEKK